MGEMSDWRDIAKEFDAGNCIGCDCCDCPSIQDMAKEISSLRSEKARSSKMSLRMALLFFLNVSLMSTLTVPIAFTFEGIGYVLISQIIMLVAYREGKRK